MTTKIVSFTNRLRKGEVENPMIKSAMSFLKRIGAEEAGITALETAIILIAFVVVASVFAFTMLSAGTFSTERGKEAIYAGLSAVQSSMEIKGGVIATSTVGVDGEVNGLVFTLANVLNGEAINLDSSANAVVVFEYRDATQRIALPDTAWSVAWLGKNDGDDLLEAGELAEVSVTLVGNLDTALSSNTEFVLEIKPPTGAVLNLQRTTPAYMEAVNDLN